MSKQTVSTPSELKTKYYVKAKEITDSLGNPIDWKEEGIDPEEELEVPTDEDISCESELDFDIRTLKQLQGKILTIIDASFGEMPKVKFVKDLIKSDFVDFADQYIEREYKKTGGSESNPLK